MKYHVSVLPKALRAIEGLPKRDRVRVEADIDALSEDPRPRGCIKLAGHANLYRIRVGNYRVIYEIHNDRLVIVVVVVAHRRESYRGM